MLNEFLRGGNEFTRGESVSASYQNRSVILIADDQDSVIELSFFCPGLLPINY